MQPHDLWFKKRRRIGLNNATCPNQVNEHYIKPLTLAAGGMSYALMKHPEGHLGFARRVLGLKLQSKGARSRSPRIFGLGFEVRVLISASDLELAQKLVLSCPGRMSSELLRHPKPRASPNQTAVKLSLWKRHWRLQQHILRLAQ